MTFSGAAHLTQPTTLYRLFDAAGCLLYVGVAGNPGRRFEQHAAEKPWWGSVSEVRLEHFADRVTAERAEASAIIDEGPVHNLVHGRRPKDPLTAQLDLRSAEEAWRVAERDHLAAIQARYELWLNEYDSQITAEEVEEADARIASSRQARICADEALRRARLRSERSARFHAVVP